MKLHKLCLTLLLLAPFRALAADSFPVSIHVDAAKSLGEMKPIWRFFGADEPNYAHMKDGKKLLTELSQLGGGQPVYFRAHNMLNSGDGRPAFKWGSTDVYNEDKFGNIDFEWKHINRIFDAYNERNIRPFLELGFMPQKLSTNPEPYQHKWKPGDEYAKIFTGWAYPPKDYMKWNNLVAKVTTHSIEKYGIEEVKQWYFETWNEPNIGYWKGTQEEFFKLHDVTTDAIKRALPEAKVGGPHTAGAGKYLKEFLEHCLRGTNYATDGIGTPLDFIAFHVKGAPKFENGIVKMGIARQLKTIEEGFRIIAAFPELQGKPVILGEADPDGCAACRAPELGYRNNTLYASYTAAAFARMYELADKYGINLEGAVTWAFEFEDQPYFAGYRVLATNGIDLPILNLFRMFSKMGGQRVAVTSDSMTDLDEILKNGVRRKPDVSALASLDSNRAAILMWHYHDRDEAGPEASVSLTLTGLPVATGTAQLREYRIDNDNGNAYIVWKRMGSPRSPTPQQYAELTKASEMQAKGSQINIADGKTALTLSLPRQGLALYIVEWSKPAPAKAEVLPVQQ